MGLEKKTKKAEINILQLQAVVVRQNNLITTLETMIKNESERAKKAENELQKLIDITVSHKIKRIFKNK